MPIYVYEVISAKGRPGKRFEILQNLSDPPLKKHPKTGKPVRRVLAAFSAPRNRYEKAVRHFEKQDRKVREKGAPSPKKKRQYRAKKKG